MFTHIVIAMLTASAGILIGGFFASVKRQDQQLHLLVATDVLRRFVAKYPLAPERSRHSVTVAAADISRLKLALHALEDSACLPETTNASR